MPSEGKSSLCLWQGELTTVMMFEGCGHLTIFLIGMP